MKYLLLLVVLLCVGAFGLWRFFQAAAEQDEYHNDDEWWIG